MVCGFGILSSCTAASQKGSAKQIYADCMETFGDREKCEKLVLKQLIGSEKTGESSQVETDRTQASVSLDPEIEKNLRLRSEIKDTLQGQNRIFVKEFLGNPDRIQFRTNSIEAFVYTRPISRHKPGAKPDLEIRVLMRNGTVVRVEHVAP
ncbi:hypothetical protein LEP1GSC161_2688 [Leptospira santarosai str. CBC1416]|uniref:Uncharacterized protein n=2 Tax=Leptospira santarosai TaxID=28183 RepID=M6W656_9LEPT|nr:hypothetical protein LEP1GSC005_1922 [Leptospira santarosai str. ST188]EMO57248.1 hypothetical protein LEP1GSC161_2688 [Leptospira santarosai str. CBC1416]EMO73395.1 hypothetical protein LEP1GSC130_2662 [Leptospira santarosai str. 200403458]EMP00321.1 hypothetical protein LEP1GSC120_3437 [Leptospira santarosai str. 200702252]OLY60904.1 hypothetical protein BV917_08020 [Leptospira santarosai serovar Guaricura]OLY65250.1 hypothetical protein BWD11_04955 [Leptospira santarosai serovar Grippoty